MKECCENNIHCWTRGDILNNDLFIATYNVKAYRLFNLFLVWRKLWRKRRGIIVYINKSLEGRAADLLFHHTLPLDRTEGTEYAQQENLNNPEIWHLIIPNVHKQTLEWRTFPSFFDCWLLTCRKTLENVTRILGGGRYKWTNNLVRIRNTSQE